MPMEPKVEIHDDGTQSADFQYDFLLDTKAEVTENDDGDLFISGYASDFGLDRQDEAFEPGAFDSSIKNFLATYAVLLYHHKFDTARGQVTEAVVDGKGMTVTARVDKPAEGSWAADIFNKIRKGTIRGFSVGGLFRRRKTEQGWRIH